MLSVVHRPSFRVPAAHFVDHCHGIADFGFRLDQVGDADHITNVRRSDIFQHLVSNVSSYRAQFCRVQFQWAVFAIEEFFLHGHPPQREQTVFNTAEPLTNITRH